MVASGCGSEPEAKPWSPVRTGDGSWTLAHPGHGEACHSRSGAWLEALERYARPCRLAERARSGETPLRVLDVGCGLGLNLAAALWAVEGTGARLHAVSLERDPEVLRATLALFERPDARVSPAERHHAPVRTALARALEEGADDVAVPLGPRAELRLLLGDARDTLAALDRAERFDAVFLDPFSPRREPELWGADFLRRVAGRMAPGSWLSTYTASFPVRLALARAGLRVGRGPAVGAKAEGTLARPAGELPPLSEAVRRRLARSLAEATGNAPPDLTERILVWPRRDRDRRMD